MNENGRNIASGFRALRRFCGQVSLLLTTADGLMQELDWKQAAGSTAVAELSKSVHSPGGWLPCYFCRFYKHSEQKHLLAFISVLIEGKMGTGINLRLQSAGLPLITAHFHRWECELKREGNGQHARA